jgi:hypothetical protein
MVVLGITRSQPRALQYESPVVHVMGVKFIESHALDGASSATENSPISQDLDHSIQVYSYNMMLSPLPHPTQHQYTKIIEHVHPSTFVLYNT